MTDFIKQAAHVKPNSRQLKLLCETPFYAFIHFGPNSCTQSELGTGKASADIFNPSELDCDGWCEAILSAGMKGVVLTAKHHDGFCLWQSDCTEYCMKNSPYKNGKGDIVKELSDACRRHGLKFGVYLSPWDRNSKYYGTPEYNDYYKSQLTELLTRYGEIFHVWFDGACGEGRNGKKQVYDYEGFIELIHKYQPNATVFNDHAGVRWCGNEAGETRHAEWAVVPSELCYLDTDVQTGPGPLSGDLSYMYNTDENIGSLGNILYSKGLTFALSEVDMSIRPSWFYHEDEHPHSLERLFDTYLRSVGGNCTFILNIPPMPNGKFCEADVKRLKELGELINKSFETNLADDAKIAESQRDGSNTQKTFDIYFNEKKTVSFIKLKEDIKEGQRVENFFVYKINEYGDKEPVFEGTTIGACRIIKTTPFEAEHLRVFIASSRDVPLISEISVY